MIPELQALGLASGAACAIVFGYVFASKINPSHGFLCLAEHLAAGIVLSATVFELAPIIPHGLETTEFAWVSAGLITGFTFLLCIRQFVGCHGHGERKCEPGCSQRGHVGCGMGTAYVPFTKSGIGSGFNFTGGFNYAATASEPPPACVAIAAPKEVDNEDEVFTSNSNYATHLLPTKSVEEIFEPIAKQESSCMSCFRSICEGNAEKTSLLTNLSTQIAWNRIAAVWIDVSVDGFLVGIATVAQGTTHENPGFIVAVALAIEILFLGVIISPLFKQRRTLGLFVSMGLACSILLASFLGSHVLSLCVNTGPFYGFVAFGVSALVWLVIEELLLETHVVNGSRFWLTLTFFLGFYFVMCIRQVEHVMGGHNEEMHDMHA